LVVLWAVAIAGGTGLLLGLCLRAPAAIAASGATFIGCLALAPLMQWSPLAAVLLGFGSLTALQMGYLAGVTLTCALNRSET
jgi:hypothetical protein